MNHKPISIFLLSKLVSIRVSQHFILLSLCLSRGGCVFRSHCHYNPYVLPVECSNPTFFYPSIFQVEIVCSAPTVIIPVFCQWSVPIPHFSFTVFSQWKNLCVFQSHIFFHSVFPVRVLMCVPIPHFSNTVYISQWRLCVPVPLSLFFPVEVVCSSPTVTITVYISQWRLCVPVPNPNVMRLLLICIHC